MNNEKSIKDIWENVKYLLGIIFLGLLYGIGSLVLLSMLLQWTLGIDITELDNIHILLFLLWGVYTIGWHLYFKNEERKKVNSSPKRLLIPFNLSAEQSLESVKAHLATGKKLEEKQPKRLFALISTEGKPPKQIAKEGWEAFQKYKRVKARVESRQKASLQKRADLGQP